MFGPICGLLVEYLSFDFDGNNPRYELRNAKHGTIRYGPREKVKILNILTLFNLENRMA